MVQWESFLLKHFGDAAPNDISSRQIALATLAVFKNVISPQIVLTKEGLLDIPEDFIVKIGTTDWIYSLLLTKNFVLLPIRFQKSILDVLFFIFRRGPYDIVRFRCCSEHQSRQWYDQHEPLDLYGNFRSWNDQQNDVSITYLLIRLLQSIVYTPDEKEKTEVWSDDKDIKVKQLIPSVASDELMDISVGKRIIRLLGVICATGMSSTELKAYLQLLNRPSAYSLALLQAFKQMIQEEDVSVVKAYPECYFNFGGFGSGIRSHKPSAFPFSKHEYQINFWFRVESFNVSNSNYSNGMHQSAVPEQHLVTVMNDEKTHGIDVLIRMNCIVIELYDGLGQGSSSGGTPYHTIEVGNNMHMHHPDAPHPTHNKHVATSVDPIILSDSIWYHFSVHHVAKPKMSFFGKDCITISIDHKVVYQDNVRYPAIPVVSPHPTLPSQLHTSPLPGPLYHISCGVDFDGQMGPIYFLSEGLSAHVAEVLGRLDANKPVDRLLQHNHHTPAHGVSEPSVTGSHVRATPHNSSTSVHNNHISNLSFDLLTSYTSPMDRKQVNVMSKVASSYHPSRVYQAFHQSSDGYHSLSLIDIQGKRHARLIDSNLTQVWQMTRTRDSLMSVGGVLCLLPLFPLLLIEHEDDREKEKMRDSTELRNLKREAKKQPKGNLLRSLSMYFKTKPNVGLGRSMADIFSDPDNERLFTSNSLNWLSPHVAELTEDGCISLLLSIFARCLKGHRVYQNYFTRHKGFDMIEYALLCTPLPLLRQEGENCVLALVQLRASVNNNITLENNVIRQLLMNFKIWSRGAASMQMSLMSVLVAAMRAQPEVFIEVIGVQMLLDLLSYCYMDDMAVDISIMTQSSLETPTPSREPSLDVVAGGNEFELADPALEEIGVTIHRNVELSPFPSDSSSLTPKVTTPKIGSKLTRRGSTQFQMLLNSDLQVTPLGTTSTADGKSKTATVETKKDREKSAKEKIETAAMEEFVAQARQHRKRMRCCIQSMIAIMIDHHCSKSEMNSVIDFMADCKDFVVLNELAQLLLCLLVDGNGKVVTSIIESCNGIEEFASFVLVRFVNQPMEDLRCSGIRLLTHFYLRLATGNLSASILNLTLKSRRGVLLSNVITSISNAVNLPSASQYSMGLTRLHDAGGFVLLHDFLLLYRSNCTEATYLALLEMLITKPGISGLVTIDQRSLFETAIKQEKATTGSLTRKSHRLSVSGTGIVCQRVATFHSNLQDPENFANGSLNLTGSVVLPLFFRVIPKLSPRSCGRIYGDLLALLKHEESNCDAFCSHAYWHSCLFDLVANLVVSKPNKKNCIDSSRISSILERWASRHRGFPISCSVAREISPKLGDSNDSGVGGECEGENDDVFDENKHLGGYSGVMLRSWISPNGQYLEEDDSPSFHSRRPSPVITKSAPRSMRTQSFHLTEPSSCKHLLSEALNLLHTNSRQSVISEDTAAQLDNERLSDGEMDLNFSICMSLNASLLLHNLEKRNGWRQLEITIAQAYDMPADAAPTVNNMANNSTVGIAIACGVLSHMLCELTSSLEIKLKELQKLIRSPKPAVSAKASDKLENLLSVMIVSSLFTLDIPISSLNFTHRLSVAKKRVTLIETVSNERRECSFSCSDELHGKCMSATDLCIDCGHSLSVHPQLLPIDVDAEDRLRTWCWASKRSTFNMKKEKSKEDMNASLDEFSVLLNRSPGASPYDFGDIPLLSPSGSCEYEEDDVDESDDEKPVDLSVLDVTYKWIDLSNQSTLREGEKEGDEKVEEIDYLEPLERGYNVVHDRLVLTLQSLRFFDALFWPENSCVLHNAQLLKFQLEYSVEDDQPFAYMGASMNGMHESTSIHDSNGITKSLSLFNCIIRKSWFVLLELSPFSEMAELNVRRLRALMTSIGRVPTSSPMYSMDALVTTTTFLVSTVVQRIFASLLPVYDMLGLPREPAILLYGPTEDPNERLARQKKSDAIFESTVDDQSIFHKLELIFDNEAGKRIIGFIKCCLYLLLDIYEMKKYMLSDALSDEAFFALTSLMVLVKNEKLHYSSAGTPASRSHSVFTPTPAPVAVPQSHRSSVLVDTLHGITPSGHTDNKTCPPPTEQDASQHPHHFDANAHAALSGVPLDSFDSCPFGDHVVIALRWLRDPYFQLDLLRSEVITKTLLGVENMELDYLALFHRNIFSHKNAVLKRSDSVDSLETESTDLAELALDVSNMISARESSRQVTRNTVHTDRIRSIAGSWHSFLKRFQCDDWSPFYTATDKDFVSYDADGNPDGSEEACANIEFELSRYRDSVLRRILFMKAAEPSDHSQSAYAAGKQKMNALLTGDVTIEDALLARKDSFNTRTDRRTSLSSPSASSTLKNMPNAAAQSTVNTWGEDEETMDWKQNMNNQNQTTLDDVHLDDGSHHAPSYASYVGNVGAMLLGHGHKHESLTRPSDAPSGGPRMINFRPAWTRSFDWAADEKSIISFDVHHVLLGITMWGTLLVTNRTLYFRPRKQACGLLVAPQTDHCKNSRWHLNRLTEMYGRRFQLLNCGIECFFVDSPEVCFSFASSAELQQFSQTVRRQFVPLLSTSGSLNPKVVMANTSWTEMWRRRQITNFEYLMRLNTISGRSYNDITQYPVFPWILSDYTSAFIDLTNPKVYRDLSKPVGALNEDKLKEIMDRYDTLDDEEVPRFMHGSHYSSSGIVLHFLVRQEPYCTLAANLQGGLFDCPDRMFFDLKSSWDSVNTSISDVKELIPEMFSLPELFINSNKLPLGELQDGQVVNDVVLPKWANNDPYEFIRIHREALESDYVSEHLHEWIDLIFGYKQVGQAAVDSHNVFYYLTYENALKGGTAALEDPIQRDAVNSQVDNFGQTPAQIFVRPHVARLPPQECQRQLFCMDELRYHRLRVFAPIKQHGDSSEEGAHGAVLCSYSCMNSDRITVVYADLHVGYYRWSSMSDVDGFSFQLKLERTKRLPCAHMTALGNNAIDSFINEVASNGASDILGNSALVSENSTRSAKSSADQENAPVPGLWGLIGFKGKNASHPPPVPHSTVNDTDGVVPSRSLSGEGLSLRRSNKRMVNSRPQLQNKTHTTVTICEGDGNSTAKLITCGYWDCSLRMHSLDNTLKEVSNTSRGHIGQITCIHMLPASAILPNDTKRNCILVSGGIDGTCRVWSVEHMISGIPTTSVDQWSPGMSDELDSGVHMGAISSVAAPDTPLVCLHVLWGHNTAITAIHYSTAMDLVLSASLSGMLCLHLGRSGLFVRAIKSLVHCAIDLIDMVFISTSGHIIVQCREVVQPDTPTDKSITSNFAKSTSPQPVYYSLHVFSVNGDPGAKLRNLYRVTAICSSNWGGDCGGGDIGSLFICGTSDGDLQIRKVNNLELVHVIDLRMYGAISSLAFTNDKQNILIGSEDGTVSVCTDPTI